MAFVTRHLERAGFEVIDVSTSREHRGYDLLARRGAEELAIEVKGSKVQWSIPDPYETEFDENLRLVADYLYVVYFPNDKDGPELFVIPRAAIPASAITERKGYRISSSFRNARVMGTFAVPLDDND